MTRRAALITALLGACILMGCQDIPFLSSGQPRTVVDYGTTNFDSNASLSVLLSIKPLLAQSTRKVLANPTPTASGTPAPADCPTVIVATVTGQNSGYQSKQTLSVTNFTNGLGAIYFYNLPADTYTVTVVAEDAAGKALKFATQSGVAIANTLSPVVHLKCEDANGTLRIDWDCQDSCDVSPSPTPTPAPANPVRDGIVGNVRGLAADAKGQVYLFAYDPAPVPTPVNVYKYGRIVRLDPDNTVEKTPVNDEVGVGDEGALTNNTVLNFYAAYEGIFRMDTSTLPAQVLPSIGVGGNFSFTVTKDNNDHLIFSSGGYGTQNGGISLYKDNIATHYFTYIGPNSQIGSEYPRYLTYDSLADRPIWACGLGIATTPADTSSTSIPPVLLQTVSGGAVAIAPTGATSTKFLFTKANDTHLYLWDRANPSAGYTSIADYSPYQPHSVERGLDGLFYVLIFPKNTFNEGSSSFRIVRFSLDPTTGSVSNQFLMVDTF